MRVAVIGATGMVGSRVVAELAGRDHQVVAIARTAGSDATGVEWRVADVADAAQLAAAVEGVDAVIGAVSARAEGDPSLTEKVGDAVEAVREAGVSRVVWVGGAGSLLLPDGSRLVDSADFPEEYKAEALDGADLLTWFRALDDVDWTFVSPAAVIAPGERSGEYRLGGDDVPFTGEGLASVTAEDFAVGLVDLVEQGSHVRERVNVAEAVAG